MCSLPPIDGNKRREMTWAQRLKRVSRIAIETSQYRSGAARVIAYIEDPAVIEKILTHIERREPAGAPSRAARRRPNRSW